LWAAAEVGRLWWVGGLGSSVAVLTGCAGWWGLGVVGWGGAGGGVVFVCHFCYVEREGEDEAEDLAA
jgi:hypothetical protein